MSNEHLKRFLIDDLKKLEIEFNYIKENLIHCDAWDKAEIEHFDMFFSYWHTHAKKL